MNFVFRILTLGFATAVGLLPVVFVFGIIEYLGIDLILAYCWAVSITTAVLFLLTVYNTVFNKKDSNTAAGLSWIYFLVIVLTVAFLILIGVYNMIKYGWALL